MKNFLKGVIAVFVTMVVVSIGRLGYIIEMNHTSFKNELLGVFLGFTITIPSLVFWLKKVSYIIDLIPKRKCSQKFQQKKQ